jgi:hypothetical protein
LGAFAKLRIAAVSFAMSVRLPAWDNSAPTGRSVVPSSSQWPDVSSYSSNKLLLLHVSPAALPAEFSKIKPLGVEATKRISKFMEFTMKPTFPLSYSQQTSSVNGGFLSYKN